MRDEQVERAEPTEPGKVTRLGPDEGIPVEPRCWCGFRVTSDRPCPAHGTTLTTPPHAHEWGEWDPRYVLNGYEKRYCECGAFQARPLGGDR